MFAGVMITIGIVVGLIAAYAIGQHIAEERINVRARKRRTESAPIQGRDMELERDTEPDPKPALEPKVPKREKSAEAPLIPEWPDVKTEGIVREMKDLELAVRDSAVRGNIHRINRYTKLILQEGREHKEVRPLLNTFLIYYLPTGKSLAMAYVDAEDDMRTKNVESILGASASALSQLADALKELYDSLFSDTAADVVADAETLSSILKQNGLTKDDLTQFISGRKNA